MKAIADRLLQVNRGDVLERMQAQFTNPDSMKQFVEKLTPQTLTEKAMFAHMFGNTASVTLSSAGTGIGRLHFAQYLARNVVGSIDKAIVEEKVAAPKRAAIEASKQNGPFAGDPIIGDAFGVRDSRVDDDPFSKAPRLGGAFMNFMQR